MASTSNRSFFAALIGDGRPLLAFTGLTLALSGLFALFQSLTGHFLPHDVAHLGMTAEQLGTYHEGRIVRFMFHDRVAFGGTLIGIGTLYLWLAEFPLRQRQAWAWWLFVLSGLFGFGSFLTYLGYGYLDTWHGLATLALFPLFVVGLWKSRQSLTRPMPWRALLQPGQMPVWRSRFGVGWALWLATSASLFLGGLIIMTVGVTTVFVPEDLKYMQVTVAELNAIHPHLVPLIAHDRAGFGGGVCCCGLTMLFCVWCGTPSRSLWQAVMLTGVSGFTTAIGVHPAIGYNDWFHLAPAVLGAVMFTGGAVLTWRGMHAEPADSAAAAGLN